MMSSLRCGSSLHARWILPTSFETWLLLSSCGSLLSIRDVSLKNFTPVSDKCTHQAPVLHHLSHGNGHLDQDSRLCMFARLRDPAGNNIDNKMLYFQWIPLFPSQKSFNEVVRKVLPGNWKKWLRCDQYHAHCTSFCHAQYQVNLKITPSPICCTPPAFMKQEWY